MVLDRLWLVGGSTSGGGWRVFGERGNELFARKRMGVSPSGMGMWGGPVLLTTVGNGRSVRLPCRALVRRLPLSVGRASE